MSFGGSTSSMNSTLKENKRLRKNSSSRLKKLREQYIGVGSDPDKIHLPKLTPEQLAEAKKKAKAYYTSRNRRINSTIALAVIGGLILVGYVIYKYLLN